MTDLVNVADPALFAELLSLRVLSTDAATGAVVAESMLSIGRGTDLDLCAGKLGPQVLHSPPHPHTPAPTS